MQTYWSGHAPSQSCSDSSRSDSSCSDSSYSGFPNLAFQLYSCRVTLPIILRLLLPIYSCFLSPSFSALLPNCTWPPSPHHTQFPPTHCTHEGSHSALNSGSSSPFYKLRLYSDCTEAHLPILSAFPLKVSSPSPLYTHVLHFTQVPTPINPKHTRFFELNQNVSFLALEHCSTLPMHNTLLLRLPLPIILNFPLPIVRRLPICIQLRLILQTQAIFYGSTVSCKNRIRSVAKKQ